jgi:hypothetical protein
MKFGEDADKRMPIKEVEPLSRVHQGGARIVCALLFLRSRLPGRGFLMRDEYAKGRLITRMPGP